MFIRYRGYLLGTQQTEISNAAMEFEVNKVSISGATASMELILAMPNFIHAQFPKNKWNVQDHAYLQGLSRKVEG